MATYLGSKGASDNGFIESLHNDLNTRNASFWETWENLTGPPAWLLRDVDDALPSASVPDSLWVSPSSSDMVDDVSVGVGGGLRSSCEIPFGFVFSGLLSLTSPFDRMLWSSIKTKKNVFATCTGGIKKKTTKQTKWQNNVLKEPNCSELLWYCPKHCKVIQSINNSNTWWIFWLNLTWFLNLTKAK